MLFGVSDSDSLLIWPIDGRTCLKAAFFPEELFPSFDNDAWRSEDKLGSDPMIAPFFEFFDMF